MRRDDGFSMIELLVVMILIAILAAIAIPVYLVQKDKANNAQAVSDMGNVRTAIETYATGHDGSYAGLDGADEDSTELTSEGFVHTAWTSLEVQSTTNTYCVVARHAHVSDRKYRLTSDSSKVTIEDLDGPDCP